MTDQTSLALEAQFLLATAGETPDFARLLDALNDRLAAAGLKRLHRTQCPIEDAETFSGRDFHLLITPGDGALTAEAAGAAELPDHVARIALCLGDGPVVKTPDMLEFEAKFGIADEVRPADPAIKTRVLHLAALALLDQIAPPAAILWGPTGQLLEPDALSAMPGTEFPGALIFTPEKTTRTTAPEGGALTGFTTRGAARFCGHEITFAPSPLGEGEAVAFVSRLIDAIVAGRIDPGQSGEVALSKTERVRLTRSPEGGIAATFVPARAPAADLADIEDEDATLFASAPESHEPPRPEPALILTEAERAAPAEPDPIPAAEPATGSRVDRVLKLMPEHFPDSVPETPEPVAASPGAAASARVPAPDPAQGDPGLRGRAHALIERAYNPAPAPGMLRHLAVGVALALVAPLAGFLLLIVTLIRGPLPKVTLGCAGLALVLVALRAGSALFGAA